MREPKKHGKHGYAFEKYDIVSDIARQFATNHWHDETEIVYISEGAIDICINGKRFAGKAGDIFVINSGEMHEIYGTETPLVYSAFVFDFGMLSYEKADLAQQKYIKPVLDGKIYFLGQVSGDEELFSVLQYINKINTEGGDCYMLLTKAALLHFFAMLMKNGRYSFKEEAVGQRGRLLKDMVEYIDQNFMRELTLKEISEKFNMSYKYFCRFFKNNFDKTFVEYLNDVRIENSVILLSRGDVSVTEAAISCGFGNMSYFTRTFKSRIGCTPSQYKKGL